MKEIKNFNSDQMAMATEIWTNNEKEIMASALLELGINENSNDTILTSDDETIYENDDEKYYKELGNYMVLIKQKFNELKGYMIQKNLMLSNNEMRVIIDKWESKNFNENISTFMSGYIMDLLLKKKPE